MKIQIRRIISVTLVCVICFTASAIYSSAAKVINSNTLNAESIEVWRWTLVSDIDSLKSYTTGTQILKNHAMSTEVKLREYYEKYLSDYKLLILYGFTESDFSESAVPTGYGTDGGVLMDKDSSTLCYFTAYVDDSGDTTEVNFSGCNVDDFFCHMIPSSTSFTTTGADLSGIPNVVFTDSSNVYLWTESTKGSPIGIYNNGYTGINKLLTPSKYTNNYMWLLSRNTSGNLYGGYLSYGSGSISYLDCPAGPYSEHANVDFYMHLNSTKNGRCMFYVGQKINEQAGCISGDKIIPSGNIVTISETATISKTASILVEPGAKLIIDNSVKLDGTITNYGTVVVSEGAMLQISDCGSFENFGAYSRECNDGKTRANEGNLIIAREGVLVMNSSSGAGSTKLWTCGGKISCAGTMQDMNYKTPAVFTAQVDVYFSYGSVFTAPNRIKTISDQGDFVSHFSYNYKYNLVNENFLLDK